jgi:predicted RNA binding protein YcfA (HicA-like mRNA interferase family)
VGNGAAPHIQGRGADDGLRLQVVDQCRRSELSQLRWGTVLFCPRSGPDSLPVRLSRILERARAGSANLRFSEVRSLAEGLGFNLSRVSGSHHIFVHPTVPELLNLQEVNGKAKPYQIRQLLRLMERYNLSLRDTS